MKCFGAVWWLKKSPAPGRSEWTQITNFADSVSQPALSRIELGGGVPDIETLRRLGNAMGVRFHVIVGNEEADHEENLLVS